MQIPKQAVLLRIFIGEDDKYQGRPLYETIVLQARELHLAGATVLRGMWGFHGAQKPHGDKLFQLSRQVPVTTIIVDPPDRIARSFDIVDELTGDHGLVTSEMVPALILVDGDLRFGGTDLADYRY